MIDLCEYERFKKLEQEQEQLCRLFYTKIITSCVVSIEGHMPVVVHPMSSGRQYDYVMTKFGVCTQLDNGGFVLDKTQLCLDLDKAVREQIQRTFLQGGNPCLNK